MFKQHILIKLIQRLLSHTDAIRSLLLVGGEVSRNLSEILNNGYIFPEIMVDVLGNIHCGPEKQQLRFKDFYMIKKKLDKGYRKFDATIKNHGYIVYRSLQDTYFLDSC